MLFTIKLLPSTPTIVQINAILIIIIIVIFNLRVCCLFLYLFQYYRHSELCPCPVFPHLMSHSQAHLKQTLSSCIH